MFSRFVFPIAVVLGALSGHAHAQLHIMVPPVPKKQVYSFTSASLEKTTPTPARVPPKKAKFEPEGDEVYHGASLPDTWSEDGLRRQIADYNSAAGKRISVVTWFASAYENGRMTTWRQNYSYTMDRIKHLGALSLIKFSTQDYAYNSTHKMAGLKEIAGGKWDNYFIEAAHTVRDFKSPIFISIDHEMNGNWYPYSESYRGSTTTAADYIAAWRRIVTIFRVEGANNAAFVWSPNVPDVGNASYADYWPGDSFVDWVGISFYSGNTMSAMDEIYETLSPRKPFFITEWATGTAKNKYNSMFPGEVEWVRQFFASLETRYPRVKAISWFNWQNGDGDYRLTRVPEQAKAYSKDIAATRYLSTPGDKFVGSNAVETPRVDVVPNEIIFKEVAAPPTKVQRPRAEVVRSEKIGAPLLDLQRPRVESSSTERIGSERIGSEKVRVGR